MVTKTVLVAGGAGFIGSHLCEHLLAMGNYVICLDNFFTGSKRNIIGVIGTYDQVCFEVIRHDITQPISLEVDHIYNLACPGSPVHYQRYPAKTILTNVVGTANLLQLAQDTGARILQVSTSEVYGDPLIHPQPETYWGNVNPIGPRSCYDEGKRCAEALAVEYHKQLGVDIRIVRPFNVYGPRMPLNDGRVVPNFIVQALRGAPLTVYGDGSQTRSFCYVSDMVRWLVGIMEHEPYIGPVNLGIPDETSIMHLAEDIIGLTGSRSSVINCPIPEDDPVRRCPDLTRASEVFGSMAGVPLADGLTRTIEDIKARNDYCGY
jgi:UDP-glucuronate decarboxylase